MGVGRGLNVLRMQRTGNHCVPCILLLMAKRAIHDYSTLASFPGVRFFERLGTRLQPWLAVSLSLRLSLTLFINILS